MFFARTPELREHEDIVPQIGHLTVTPVGETDTNDDDEEEEHLDSEDY